MYKAHWDSQKEYERFWAGGGNSPLREIRPQKSKKPKKRRFIAALAALVVCAGALYAFSADRHAAASQSVVDANPSAIPAFSGQDAEVLNGNMPNFSQEDMLLETGLYFSDLDGLGRCGTAFAVLHRSMMPTKEREGIGMIKPSGWHQNRYEGIVQSDPPYLYNRCHMIAFALCGENANEKNLITGTRHFNETAMLPYEKQVMRYLDDSDNRVLYRVSPYFGEGELLARGVEIEAYSVEDGGAGVCFHVFVYNHQPGVEIDYRTGENHLK